MSARPTKIPNLPNSNTLTGNSMFIVEKVSSNSSVTSHITFDNLVKGMVKGPFANDATANTGGVLVNQLYYSSDGTVRIRLN